MEDKIRAWLDQPFTEREKANPNVSRLWRGQRADDYRYMMREHALGLWRPRFAKSRYGGYFITNLYYPDGAVGCIVSARHTASGKFELACPPAGYDKKFRTRKEAAYAELALVLKLWEDEFNSATVAEEEGGEE